MRITIVTALLLCFSTTAMAQQLRSVDPKTVIDGDPFYVSVRLLGIDAPEEGKRAKCDQERELGNEAGDKLKQLLQGCVTMDVRGVDKFGRLLARVELSDGQI